MNYIRIIITVVIGFVFLLSCEDEEKSKQNSIISFSVAEQVDSASINTENKEISIIVSSTTDLKSLKPEIKVSDKASVSPASGASVDFTSRNVLFTVTAEDGTRQDWKVTVLVVYPNLNSIPVNAITYDNNSVQWVGSDAGLFKSVKSGYALVDIGIAGKVSALAFDSKSNSLWIATSEGLVQGTFQNNTISLSSIDKSNLSNSNLKAVHVDSYDNKWVGSVTGLSMLKNSRWKKTGFAEPGDEFNIDNLDINSIAHNGSDYYFATNGRRVVHAYGMDETADAFSGASMLYEPYNGNALTDTMYVVFVDSKGRQWMAGNAGVQWHPDVNVKLDGFSFNGLPSNKVHAIAEASNGNIWIGTENGIAIFNETDFTVSTASLPDPYVTAIAFDKAGTAWVGTKKGLVSIK